MKWKLIILIVGVASMFSCQKQELKEYQIIPYPQSVTYSSGWYELGENVTIACSALLMHEAEMLKEYLKSDFDIDSKCLPGKTDASIVLQLSEDGQRGNEEYSLQVSSKRICINAATSHGIFYGIQSLRQMIVAEQGRWIVQKGIISDRPAFVWRAFMLDEGRNFKGKKEVKRILNQMARLKMNTFHWHLTDDQGWRIEIKKYPKLTEVGAFRDSTQIGSWKSTTFDPRPHGGFYTQEDIKEIVSYAEARHIQIVPEIEMPGHSSAAIAAYPWLGTIGKPIKVLCRFGTELDLYKISDPKVIQFLDDVLTEVIALFPSPVIHIGGDEVRFAMWQSSPEIRAYMKRNKLSSPAALQVAFTNEISNRLATKGKRMMGWNDITGAKLHEYNDDVEDVSHIQKLAEGTIVHFWKGDLNLIRETIEKGYNIVNSYHMSTYLDYDYNSISLAKAYSFNPIPDSLPKIMEKNVLGLGCQMWGEFINTVEKMNYKIYPRIAAYAEVGWTLKENKDYNRFCRSLANLLKSWDREKIKYGPVDEVDM